MTMIIRVADDLKNRKIYTSVKTKIQRNYSKNGCPLQTRKALLAKYLQQSIKWVKYPLHPASILVQHLPLSRIGGIAIVVLFFLFELFLIILFQKWNKLIILHVHMELHQKLRLKMQKWMVH